MAWSSRVLDVWVSYLRSQYDAFIDTRAIPPCLACSQMAFIWGIRGIDGQAMSGGALRVTVIAPLQSCNEHDLKIQEVYTSGTKYVTVRETRLYISDASVNEPPTHLATYHSVQIGSPSTPYIFMHTLQKCATASKTIARHESRQCDILTECASKSHRQARRQRLVPSSSAWRSPCDHQLR